MLPLLCMRQVPGQCIPASLPPAAGIGPPACWEHKEACSGAEGPPGQARGRHQSELTGLQVSHQLSALHQALLLPARHCLTSAAGGAASVLCTGLSIKWLSMQGSCSHICGGSVEAWGSPLELAMHSAGTPLHVGATKQHHDLHGRLHVLPTTLPAAGGPQLGS